MNSSALPIRVGLIVPSSNVTIETELPALLARHKSATFTFHSSRMRMQEVSEKALQAMNAQRERCVAELTDASCDALVTPYLKPLAEKVVDYIAAEQIEVTDWVALEEPDNAAVARPDISCRRTGEKGMSGDRLA